MPERVVYRPRTKLPPNTVYVGRPTRWGNPYPVKEYGRELCLKLFENSVRGVWDPHLLEGHDDGFVVTTYNLHCDFRARFACHPSEAAHELRGKNLACWCKLTEACHADIWLRIANER